MSGYTLSDAAIEAIETSLTEISLIGQLLGQDPQVFYGFISGMLDAAHENTSATAIEPREVAEAKRQAGKAIGADKARMNFDSNQARRKLQDALDAA